MLFVILALMSVSMPVSALSVDSRGSEALNGSNALVVTHNVDIERTQYTEDEVSPTQALQNTGFVQVTRHYWFLEPTEAYTATVSHDDLME